MRAQSVKQLTSNTRSDVSEIFPAARDGLRFTRAIPPASDKEDKQKQRCFEATQGKPLDLMR